MTTQSPLSKLSAIFIASVFTGAITFDATAQRILIDDFNDGVADGWTTIDSTIGQPYGPGTFDASSGAYHFESGGEITDEVPGGGFLAATWEPSTDPLYSNGFLRAKVRAETEGSLASVLLRTSGSLETGFDAYLFFGTTADGRFAFNRIKGSRNVQSRSIELDQPFGVNEDWYLEAGAVEDQLSLKAWPVGEPEPACPQLMLTDRSYSSGTLGLSRISTKTPSVVLLL